MKFKCREISINDDEFGCTVSLSDNTEPNNFEKEWTVDEIISSLGQYVMLQKTYAENEFEQDYYYFETSNFDKSGELKDFEITLTQTKFILNIDNDKYEIQINPDRQVFEELKEALKKLVENKGTLTVKN